MKPWTTLARPLGSLVWACVALLALATPALADSAATPTPDPAKASLSANAPLAVRAKAKFTVQGTASTAVSPGETITVTLERFGSNWSVVSTAAVAIDAHRRFSVRMSAGSRGYWRIRAALPGSESHTAAARTRAFRVMGSKVIALTFDDGPWPSSTAAVVSALAKNNARATFFMLGSQVGGRAKLAKSVVSHGNAVGVHSWNHAIMTRRSAATNAQDLKRCKKAVLAATGIKAHWFRPPYGATNRALKKTAASLGLKQVIWNVDTLDWKYRTKSSVVSRALARAKNGRVILMHDGGGPRAATVAAVPTIIRKLRAKGFDFATLDEMAALGYRIP
jgi:peptidoglycan-N-acetylglucosamine deacetylase